MDRAHRNFESAISLSGTKLSPSVWPEARQAQALFQRQVMQAMVDPAAHSHEAPIEVLADAVAAKPITAVTVRFPEEFGKVLVVSYQPKQVWVDRKGQEIHF